MARILIGNDFDDDLRPREGATWWAQRLVWFAEDDDIVVLPARPEEAFLRYVTSMTGTRLDSVRLLVPPQDPGGSRKLTARRLADERFLGELRAAMAGDPVTDVLALWPDAAVTGLARAVGVRSAVPGFGFFDQGGSAISNSKSVFRAMAAGIGLRIPHGQVCGREEDAADVICELVGAGRTAILKKDYMSGGAGNEIVSPTADIRPVGARHLVELADEEDIRAYLAKRWGWLTDDDRHLVVVEEYIPDSVAVFAEFLLSDDGIAFGNHGVMLSEPLASGQFIPARGVDDDALAELVREGRRLCEPLYAMGYRGRLSADAIVSPDGEVLFTEYNGRVTGSTHIYQVLGEKVVGRDFTRGARVLKDCIWPAGWRAASYDSALEAIASAGIAYDRATRKGVILCSAFDERDNTVMHCVVAEDVAEVNRYEDSLRHLFSG